jgi:hypothetical protein
MKLTTYLLVVPRLGTNGYIPPLPHMPSWCVQGIVIILIVFLFLHLITRYVMTQGQTLPPESYRITYLWKIRSNLNYLLRYCLLKMRVVSRMPSFSIIVIIIIIIIITTIDSTECVILRVNTFELPRSVAFCCLYVLRGNRVCCVKTYKCKCAS